MAQRKSTDKEKENSVANNDNNNNNDDDNSDNDNHNNAADILDEVSDIDIYAPYVTRWNCNQVRTRITTFLNNTGVKVSDFQSKLRVSAQSYRNFMRRSGPHAGHATATYHAAHQFFAKREDKGLKTPRAKNITKADEAKYDVSHLPPLPGEPEGRVPVYDTCDDVRHKIEAHLRRSDVTPASFARAISTCQGNPENGRNPTPNPVQGRQVTDFLHKGKRGPMSGNTSKAFYAAYVYFEKLRMRDGKPKTKKRLEMEDRYANRGIDRDTVTENVRYSCVEHQAPYVDQYGQVEIGPRLSRSRGLLTTWAR